MATVWIPSLLRSLAEGQSQVTVPGRTVGDVIDALESAYPGLKSRLLHNNQINPVVQVLVDNRTALLGPAEPVAENSEVLFLPTISGG
jgi:molybdopterin converting factor small subunit